MVADMKTPKFTDAHRYPHGYVKSEATDIRATFRRVQRQLADQERREREAEEERKIKVTQMVGRKT
jgi:hypothetical protein